ncbi:MAG TPA: hypothetical protein VG368_05740 [Acidimicrobiales bacterium]|nr:hypothetical protein [Acidimicrobiales bacterium]
MIGRISPKRPAIEVTIARLDRSGDGLGIDEGGMRHVVPGTLPGERVMARTRRRVRGHYWSQLVEVIDPSPMRVTAPCRAYGEGCGGCQLQHLSLEHQRGLKRAFIEERLATSDGIALPDRIDVVYLEPWHFRTTLRVGVDAAGAAGFRKRRTHHVIGGSACEVAHPLLNELLVTGRYVGADEVTLRCGDRTGERLALAAPKVDRLEVPPDVRSDFIHEVAAGRRWRISAQSFFQSRPDAVDVMGELVAEAALEVDGPRAALDLYSGVGVFAGVLADTGWAVTSVESAPSAVADAQVNLAGDEVTIVSADVGQWRPTPASLVVADPSRIGVGRDGCAVIASSGARRVVLISCDVTGLTNDARSLVRAGYEMTTMSIIDVFPHTFHVEIVSTFDKVRGAS